MVGPLNRETLHDCEIFENLWIAFVSSSSLDGGLQEGELWPGAEHGERLGLARGAARHRVTVHRAVARPGLDMETNVWSKYPSIFESLKCEKLKKMSTLPHF